MKKALLFILLFCLNIKIFSQETGTLRGFVTDSLTSEALVYANAYIKELGKGANSDVRGYFLIPGIPFNKTFSLTVSYVGYKSKTIQIKVTKEKVTQYNIPLFAEGIELKTITQVGEKYKDKNETNLSIQRITSREIEMMPKGVETDVFRSIKYLAGIQSTGDVSAKYYVRGGASNQNLVLVDGVTIYNPFHALGLFSVIDPDMINNVEFFKGGFSAEYGGRLSSVMSIITKDGNKNNFSAKATASFLTGKILIEGPIPNGSFILTGRKSYSNNIIKKFLNEQNIPIDFYDFSFKANYSSNDFLQGAKFLVNGFYSGDNIKHVDPRIEDYKWNNNVFGFKWFQVGDSPLFYELSLSASSFRGEVEPKISNARKTENSVDDLGIQMNFTYMFETKDEIGIGFHIKQIKTSLFLENDRSIPTDLGSSGANISLYLKYKLMQFDFLGLDFGTRLNLASLSKNENRTILEPRLNITLRILPELALKGAVGIYQQELTTISDENEVINIFEPWIISPDYLKPAISKHFIVGLETNFSNSFTLNVESYYKIVNDLPLINENKILISDKDFIAGKGESYGLELFTRINPEPINFTISYTNAFAYKIIDDKYYYPRYDIRHSLNLGLEIELGKGWNTSLAWIYNSGLPFTQILGYYDKLYFDNFFAPWNQFDPRRPFTIIATQNLGRLPDYHRLDFSLSKKINFDFFNMKVDFSVINLYNRKNIFYFKRDTGERVNMLPLLPTATVRIEL